MANSDSSIITAKLKGSVGKQLVFRNWAGKTIVAKAPGRRTTAPTQGQAETQEKFLLASRYAKAVITNADQSLAQAYAMVLKPRQHIYSRALEDFMSPPVVKSIDTRQYNGIAGDKITVRAFDDFRITNVKLEIYDATRTLLETANAVQTTNGLDWVYTTTQGNAVRAGTTIRAIATDVPGNEGMLELVL